LIFSLIYPERIWIPYWRQGVYMYFYWKMFIAIPCYLHLFFKFMQTYLFIFADLLIKYSFCKKLCDTNNYYTLLQQVECCEDDYKKMPPLFISHIS
jgi:hypothetical protein